MEFIPTKKHKEVFLEQGLSLLKSKETDKLYSDGLCANEYIYYDKNKGFCYEDGCVIGRSIIKTINRLKSLGWPNSSKFYIKITPKYDYEKEKEQWFKNYINYYDENMKHAELAFISNGYNIKNQHTSMLLHKDNVEFEENMQGIFKLF